MSAEAIQKLCDEAMARIIESINRSSAQHIRYLLAGKTWGIK